MAIDYVTTNTGLFFRAGKIIKAINARLARATTDLPAELKTIADPFELADMTELIAGLYDDYRAMQESVTAERTTLAQYVNQIFTARAVIDELAVTSDDINDLMLAIYRRMIEDSATVARSVVTLGSVTAASSNRGNGTVLTSKLLDGYSPPIAGGPTNILYAGLNSELAPLSQSYQLVCTRDSSSSSSREGTESFSWSGAFATGTLDYRSEGVGSGPGLTVNGESGNNRLRNGDLNTWISTNTPVNWTVIAGTVGTHILRESTASNVHRGLYSLRFAGNGTQASIKIGQPVDVNPLRLYCVTMRVKASAASGTGSFTAQFEGTGYTAGSTEKITISAGSMPTAAFTASGSLQSFWAVAPALIPDDWQLTIANAGTPGSGSSVWVDSVSVTPAVYFGGHAAVIVPGSARWAVGDRLNYTVTNDGAGVFQEFWRQWFGIQLPSAASSPTIGNGLAT